MGIGREVLREIASSGSGVDCVDLQGSRQAMARMFVEADLVVVNQDGWFGPRFVATQKGRKLANVS
jgi:S-adenosylmethionine:diacylglycerol 3-amino-3-carboxypropyl transferase